MHTMRKLAAVAALALAVPALAAVPALVKDGAYRMGNMASQVAAVSGYVYLPQQDGLRVLDARDPAAIAAVVTLPGSYGDVVVAGRTLYAVGSRNYEAGVVLFDVTTPAAPVEIGFAPVPGAKDLAVGPGLLYVLCFAQGQNAEYTPAGLRVVSVANVAAPAVIGWLPLPDGAYPHRLVASGSQVYVAAGDAGLRVVDVSEPAQPREAAVFPLGAVYGVAVSGSYLYATEHGYYCPPDDYCGPTAGRLHILDVSRPECPRVVTSFARPQAPESITVDGNVAYMSEASIWMQTNRTKLTAVDVSNPSAPVDVGYYLTQDAGREVAVTSGHVFAFARGTDAPYVFDLVALRAPVAGVQVCPAF